MRKWYAVALGGLFALAVAVAPTAAQNEKKVEERKAEEKAAEKKAEPPAQPAYLRVLVPAGAALEIEGQKTVQQGDVRRFQSPPLQPGKKYVYDLKATYTEDGKEVVKTKTVNVKAGEEVEVAFVAADAVAAAPQAKKDDKKEAKKDDKKDDKDLDRRPDVIFVPTPDKVVEKMLTMAGVKDGDVVFDLGCGDGRIVVTAVTKFKAKRGVGIDIDPERIKDSTKRVEENKVKDTVEIRRADIFKLKDLGDATVITLYLLPDLNRKLMPQLKQLKPGTRIVSHDFDMGDWKPEKTEKVDVDGVEHTVYLWTIGKDEKK